MADGAGIAIRLDPKLMDLRNLAAPCPLPSDLGTCTLANSLSAAAKPGRFRAIMRGHGTRRRFHGHTRRILGPVVGWPEAVGHRPELDQIVSSIELTICTFVYKRTRIDDEFQEYRIMKRLSIFRVQRSR